jgi:SagB-type dehydrogenase family enzyme
LYCTGDLGRRLPDGTIEFLGRKDFQVKMHGLRIELGEIEAVLGQHPLVRSAVVTATETNQGKRLVAHLVLEQDTLPATAEPADFFTEITAQQSETLLLEKTDRIQFKLGQRGLRPPTPDLEIIPCGTPGSDQAELEKYSRRRSYRQFLADPLPFAHLSNLLRNLSQVEIPGLPIPKYLYPSGGGLYPVQTYLSIKEGKVEGLRGGTYYYHPQQHSLVLLHAGAVIDPAAHIATNQPIFQESAFSLFLVAQMAAIEPMYGSLARDFCLLEAGYMGQLLMNAAPDYHIGLCPAGSVAFADLRPLFLLEDTHVLLHTLFGGAIASEQTTIPAYLAEITSTAASLGGHAQGEASQVSATLRSYLREKLPEYMLPSLFRVVEQLPLTANGKVDRKALSAPALIEHEALARPYAPPTTDLERVLAEIWAEVLQVERPGIHDNFVELGGNSLHIVQLHQKLQQALQREIVIVELFQYPTIAALAEALGQEPETEPPAFQSSVMRAEARRGSRQRTRSSSREQKGEGGNVERLS